MRVFDVDKINIVTKMQPLASEVTAIEACNYCKATLTSTVGQTYTARDSPFFWFLIKASIVIAGSREGLIAILNLKQSITLRIIHDHRGAPITSVHSKIHNNNQITYWAAASRDRRVSIWECAWYDDKCEMIDWLTFSAPPLSNKNESKMSSWQTYPPSLLKFATNINSNTLVYVGYGSKKQIIFYDFQVKKILKTLSLSEWPESIALSPKSNLIALGTKTRVLQLKDLNDGTFQDYLYHSDDVSAVCFSVDGNRLFTVSFNEIFIWDINV